MALIQNRYVSLSTSYIAITTVPWLLKQWKTQWAIFTFKMEADHWQHVQMFFVTLSKQTLHIINFHLLVHCLLARHLNMHAWNLTKKNNNTAPTHYIMYLSREIPLHGIFQCKLIIFNYDKNYSCMMIKSRCLKLPTIAMTH